MSKVIETLRHRCELEELTPAREVVKATFAVALGRLAALGLPATAVVALRDDEKAVACQVARDLEGDGGAYAITIGEADGEHVGIVGVKVGGDRSFRGLVDPVKGTFISSTRGLIEALEGSRSRPALAIRVSV